MSFFDHFSSSPRTGFGTWFVNKVKQTEFSLIKPFLNPGSSILEIGPGMGEMQELLYQNGFKNYVAVEPNPSMRNALIKKGIRVKDYLIPVLPEANDSYDAIYMADVFEHLNGTTEAQLFIQHAKRVLRPGGIICIVSPDYLHWREDFHLSDYTHENITTARRTLQLFLDNGITPIQKVYLSGFFTGQITTLFSLVTHLANIIVNRDQVASNPYNLVLSFRRRFMVIGQKQ